jgi:hypothetical protein
MDHIRHFNDMQEDILMARFLITMHMPAGSSANLVHQVTLDHEAADLAEFCMVLNDNAFVVGRQHYFTTDKQTGEKLGWRDRGELILNTNHIGKVSLYFDGEAQHLEDEPRFKQQNTVRRDRNYRY